MSDHPSLLPAFDRLELPDDIRALIMGHHSEAHRHYHTLRHIDLMLGQIPAGHAYTPEMMIATLFHDIIYNPARSDNEELSRRMFEAAADHLAPREPLGRPLDRPLVCAMIMATKSHHFREQRAAGDEAINLLLRADLSILWHPDPEVYAWYAAGVRKEYGFVPDAQFREARGRILTGLRDDLLQSRQLTPAEAQMLTRNIAWELNG